MGTPYISNYSSKEVIKLFGFSLNIMISISELFRDPSLDANPVPLEASSGFDEDYLIV